MVEQRLEDLPELMDLAAAAKAVEMTPLTLRKAIKRFQAGDKTGLEAFIPRGKDPLRAGPGLGYRITREALQRWYFGK